MLRRLLWLFVLFGFLGQVTGAMAAVDTCADLDACGEECPDEPCSPQCHDCLCGVVLAVEVPRLRLGTPSWSFPEAEPSAAPTFAPRLPGFPDPREILRVPRASSVHV